MKYPILYEQNATDFFSLGLGPLKNTLSAKVIEERNGSFYLEAEILVDSPIFPLVLNDCLIKADAGHLLKDQRFRIKRIVPKHDGTAEIYAEHISYLSEELTLKPEVTINGSASGALSAWKGAIVEPNPFVVDSDISTTNSTKWRIDKVENPRQALGGTEGSILDVWGGEYRFDNYRISLLQKRGTTANTVLAYGRNITDFEQERNIANTYTSIVPFAIYTDDNEQEITVTVDGYKVNSQYADNYPNPRSLPVNFSDKFGHDEIPTKAKLQQLAEQYIADNEVGVPKTSIRVSFLDLSKSADYDKYKHLEEVNLCDDVRVVYPKLGVNTVAKVIRVVWNVLTESYDEIEIGEKRTTLATKINEQSKEIKEINNQTNYALISADGKNIIFYGLYGQDGLGEPTATKVGDSWYKPDGEFTELYIWNGTIWEFIMSTKENHEIRETIEAIEEEIVVMTGNINTAVDNANQAVIDANFAKDQAETATTLATSANQSAQDAVSQSSQAHQLAVQSATDASTALSNAQTAISDAQNALNKSIKTNAITYAVSTSQNTVPTSGWQATVPTASSTQYVWTRTAVTLQDDSVIYIYNVGGRGAQGVKGDTGAGGANAPKITAVKPQFYLSTSNTSQAGGSWSDTIPTWVEGRHYWVRYVTTYDNSTTSTSTPTLDTGLNTALVTSLEAKSATESLSTTVSQHATQIEARALKTTVDTLTGRVDTAEGSITANATAITQKASQSSVDTLSGRVSTAEGQISVQAGQIAQRLTASEVNSLVDGKGYATQASVNSQVSRIDGDINSWNSQLQTVQAKVDGIEIGGRNFLRGSSSEWQDYDFTGLTTPTTNYTLEELGLKVGDTLYASGEYQAISGTMVAMQIGFVRPGLSTVYLGTDEVQVGETKKVSGTAIIPSGTTQIGLRHVRGSEVGTRKTGRYRLTGLYKSTVPVDWSPAPEDLATVTDLTTNVNQINQTITNTNNSIQLLTQTVTQNVANISSVSADLTVANGKITGLTSTTNGHTTKIGTLETSYSGLQSTVANVQTALDGKASTTAFSSLQQTVQGIQTTVADKANQSQVTQLSNQIVSVIQKTEWQTISTVVDLDDFVTTGKFFLTNTTGSTNLPAPAWGYLIVDSPRSANDRVIQTYQRDNNNRLTYQRILIGNVWTVWKIIADNIDISETQSRITQLSDQINLRVTKNDVINQINVSTEGILIAGNKVRITGQTSIDNGVIKTAMIGDAQISGAKIANATINSAKIISLDVGKLTAGMINTSNITIGTATSGKRVNITGAGLVAHDNNGRLRVKLGVQDLAGDGQSDPSTLVFYTGNGTRSASIGTNTNDTFIIGSEQWLIHGLIRMPEQLTLQSNDLRFETMGTTYASDHWRVGGVTVNGVVHPGMYVPRTSAGVLGTSNYPLRQIYSTSVDTGYLNVGYGRNNPQEGDLVVSNNGTRGFVRSRTVYNTTYGGGPTVTVSADGWLGRITSARKYKTDIQLADMTKAKTVLQIKPASWLDKAELADKGHPNRYYGFIADEFDQLGLNEVVMYGSDGQVESLAYDRISMYHNVILSEHEQEIQNLKNANAQLLGEIGMLRGEVQHLRQLVA